MFTSNLRLAANERLVAQIKQNPLPYITGSVGWLAIVLLLIFRTNFSEDVDFFYHLLLLPIYVYLSLLGYHTKRFRKDFWTLFAFKRNGVHELTGKLTSERALIFNHGNKNSQRIEHVVRFDHKGKSMRVLQFVYSIGSGKSKTEHRYTVFRIQFSGHFPHMYLNYTGDTISFMAGENISLPQEFQSKYKLSAPRKYEVEALQLFTPELLQRILASKLRCDIELLDNELLFLIRGEPSNEAELEEELGIITEFSALLAPKLDQFKYSPIGDQSPYLRPSIPV